MQDLSKLAEAVTEAIENLVKAEGGWQEKREAVIAASDDETNLGEFLAWDWPEDV